jgi:hypothetical protein
MYSGFNPANFVDSAKLLGASQCIFKDMDIDKTIKKITAVFEEIHT